MNHRSFATIRHPSIADFTVHWRGTKDTPGAFFPKEDTSWFWPGNAVRFDSFLIVFLMRVCASDIGLGFRTCGHAAFIIDELDGLRGFDVDEATGLAAQLGKHEDKKAHHQRGHEQDVVAREF